jgi:hypothetical protein
MIPWGAPFQAKLERVFSSRHPTLWAPHPFSLRWRKGRARHRPGARSGLILAGWVFRLSVTTDHRQRSSYLQRRGSADELLGVGVSPRNTAPSDPQPRPGSPRSAAFALRGVEERRPLRLAIRRGPTLGFTSVITWTCVPCPFAPGCKPRKRTVVRRGIGVCCRARTQAEGRPRSLITKR